MNKIHAEEIADKLITISEQHMRRYTVTPWLDDDGKPQIDIEETNDVVFNGTPMSNDEWLNSDRRVWYRDDIVDFKVEALQKRIAELETVLKKIWKISSNRRGVRVLIDKVLPEGGGDEMISPKGIITSKKAYDRFHAEGGGEVSDE